MRGIDVEACHNSRGGCTLKDDPVGYRACHIEVSHFDVVGFIVSGVLRDVAVAACSCAREQDSFPKARQHSDRHMK